MIDPHQPPVHHASMARGSKAPPSILWRIAPVVGLVFMVPWIFSGNPTERFLGYPAWCWQAVVTCVLYAILVAVSLRKAWKGGGGER